MAEKEYIERNNVISHKRPFTEFDEGGWSCKVQAVAVEDIQNIPAADVVEVVKCKDCIHYSSNKPKSQLHRSGYCLLNEEVTDDKREPNDFCSYGERDELDTAAEIISQYAGMPLHQLVEIMAEAPNEDVEPVRHGHWYNRGGRFRCSVCDNKALLKDIGGTGGWSHEYEQQKSPYCPNCGAKMDGDTSG